MAPGRLLLGFQALSYLELPEALSTLAPFFSLPSSFCLLRTARLEIRVFRKDREWGKNLDGDEWCVQDASTCVPSLRSSAAPKGLTV